MTAFPNVLKQPSSAAPSGGDLLSSVCTQAANAVNGAGERPGVPLAPDMPCSWVIRPVSGLAPPDWALTQLKNEVRLRLGAQDAGAVLGGSAAGCAVPAVVEPVSDAGVSLGDGSVPGWSCWVTVPTSGGLAEESDDPAAAGTATATRLVESRAANASLGRTTQITTATLSGYARAWPPRQRLNARRHSFTAVYDRR